MSKLKQGGTLLLLALLGIPCHLHAANAPYEIDIKELDKQKAPAPPKPETKKPAKPKKKHGAAKAAKEHEGRAAESGYVRYTVRPGDHIFKILMVRFGMSNEEAERLIPEVTRINHINDIKKLQVGQTLLIPAKGRHPRTGVAAKKHEEQAEEMLKAASKLEQAALAPEQGAPEAVPAPAPVAPAPVAPAPAPPAAQPATAPTWVCSVADRDTAKIVDSVLNALSISWSRNRIIRSQEGAANAYSIRVDRYFEYKGERYIVSIGETDPYSYTLIRILESSGYKTLTLTGSEEFKTVTEKLLGLVGVAPDFGNHPWTGGKESAGFLLQPEEAGGRRVLITADRVDAHQKWVMKQGCLVR